MATKARTSQPSNEQKRRDIEKYSEAIFYSPRYSGTFHFLPCVLTISQGYAVQRRAAGVTRGRKYEVLGIGGGNRCVNNQQTTLLFAVRTRGDDTCVRLGNRCSSSDTIEVATLEIQREIRSRD